MKREKVEVAAPPLRQRGIRTHCWHTKLCGEMEARCTKGISMNRRVVKWEKFEAITLACVTAIWIKNTSTLFYVESLGTVR